MPPDVLADSSFLFALHAMNDRYHTAARRVADTIQMTQLVPQVVLTEVAFLARRAGGVPAVAGFLDTLVAAQIPLQEITLVDLQRARTIMAEYDTAQFDFVDCCIMALAERLNITQVCTFDRRDFSIFRPTHCDFLDLLP